MDKVTDDVEDGLETSFESCICFASDLLYCPSYQIHLTIRHAHMIRLQGNYVKCTFLNSFYGIGKVSRNGLSNWNRAHHVLRYIFRMLA